MATIITERLGHAPHEYLSKAIHGHAEIVAVIAEHAAHHAAEIEARRQEVARAELERRSSGAGTD